MPERRRGYSPQFKAEAGADAPGEGSVDRRRGPDPVSSSSARHQRDLGPDHLMVRSGVRAGPLLTDRPVLHRQLDTTGNDGSHAPPSSTTARRLGASTRRDHGSTYATVIRECRPLSNDLRINPDTGMNMADKLSVAHDRASGRLTSQREPRTRRQ